MADKKDRDRKIFNLISENGKDVAKRITQEFGVSRQTANTYLKDLLSRNLIEAQGSTRARVYKLATTYKDIEAYECDGLEEDRIWQELIAPVVAEFPENVRDIWRYGVTEMVNNAIDHSGSIGVFVKVQQNALFTEAWVMDEGEGIFNKIQRELGLYDPREAILELAKGKLTTDPEHHTGEGIFFTSKIFDEFTINSGSLSFMHVDVNTDWLMEGAANNQGTVVYMRLLNHSQRILKTIFDEFAAPEEYTFSKTIVPVRLAQYEGEKLVSRSQAKRLYLRFERFRTVILDFEGVTEIGQAFADELFRVFVAEHPTVELIPVKTTEAVSQMIKRAQARAAG